VQASETILGPIEQTSSPTEIGATDPTDQPQEQAQEQEQAEKDSDKSKDSDDSGVDASLGLINTGPVQLKTDLQEPVTSGGLDVINDIPGGPG
jgi:hypothetical protein